MSSRKTSIRCFNCGEGFIWDLRFVNTNSNQPNWKCDNDLGCNYSKRYGKYFSWASWDSLPKHIIKNESEEEKSSRIIFEEKMIEKIDRDIRDEQALEAIKNSLPRIGKLEK